MFQTRSKDLVSIYPKSFFLPPFVRSIDTREKKRESSLDACVPTMHLRQGKKISKRAWEYRSSNNQEGNNVARIVERLNRLPFARDFPWKYNLFEDLSALNTTMETKQWKISHVYYVLAKRRF